MYVYKHPEVETTSTMDLYLFNTEYGFPLIFLHYEKMAIQFQLCRISYTALSHKCKRVWKTHDPLANGHILNKASIFS